MSALPRVMTPLMVAEIWHCSERHVRNLIASGELPSFRAGGKLIRVRGEDVEAYECALSSTGPVMPPSGRKTADDTAARLARLTA